MTKERRKTSERDARARLRTSPPSLGQRIETKARMSEASSSVAQVGHDGRYLQNRLLAPKLPPRTRRGQHRRLEVPDHFSSWLHPRSRLLDLQPEPAHRLTTCGAQLDQPQSGSLPLAVGWASWGWMNTGELTGHTQLGDDHDRLPSVRTFPTGTMAPVIVSGSVAGSRHVPTERSRLGC